MRIQSLSGLSSDAARAAALSLTEEHDRSEHHNGGVDEEGRRQGHDRINRVEADGAPDGPFVLPQSAGLNQAECKYRL